MKKIIGISKFTSKKGLACACIYVNEEFSSKEIENGACGIKSVPVMAYGSDADCINDKFLNKELVGFFGYVNGGLVVQNPSFK